MGRHTTQNAERKYTIGQMWDIHREVMRLAVSGMKQTEIAYELGVTAAMVSYTLNSPIVKRQLDFMRAARDGEAIDVGKRISELAKQAVEVVGGLLNESLPNIRLAAAKDVLDRAGYAPIKRIQAEVSTTHFTSDEIASIKKRAREIGLVIDVTPQASEASVAVPESVEKIDG